MIERDVLAITAGAAEAPRAEHAGHCGERGDVLLVVPLVELGLQLRLNVHGVEEEAAGARGWELVAGQDLIALEPHEAIHACGNPLRPRREVLPADRSIGRALKDSDALEVVGGHGDPRILGPEPALAHEEARHALPFGQVLRVVPVVELVLRHLRDAHGRNQRALGHRRLLLGRRPYCISRLSVIQRWMSWAIWS